MRLIKNITNPLERRRVQFGYSQQDISKLLGITQSQYSRIEKGDTDPNKHIKKLSEIFNCEPKEVFQGRILREIEDEFLNDSTNSFQRTFHERKHGLVHLKIEGWFTRKQITDNYEMLIKELDKYSESIAKKDRWLVLNKIDLLNDIDFVKNNILKKLNWKGKVFCISAINGKGCKDLSYEIMKHIELEKNNYEKI